MTEGRCNLSVCMIVRNESERLPLAIGSVRRIADELIVVDTGSTDDTLEVARSLGAKITCHEWRDDFASARNASLREAKGEWILCLDADEVVPPESEGKILEAIAKEADAYFVRLESIVDSSAGRLFVNFFPRLFRNMDGVRFEGRVHEQIYPSLERLGARIEISDIAIKHRGYGLSTAELTAKASRNAELLLKQIESDPEDSLALFHLGEAYSMMGEHAKAVSHYRQALDGRRLPAVVRAAVLQNLGGALVRLKKYDDALVVLRKAQEVDQGLLTLHLVVASALYGMRKFERAEREMSSYISRSQGAHSSLKLRLGHDPDIARALVLLAKCRLARGETGTAREALEDALKIDSRLGDAHVLLGKIAFTELKFGQAAVHYEEAVKSFPTVEQVAFELAKAYVASGSNAKAIRAIERAIESGIAGTDLLRCLGVIKIKAKDFLGAVEAYRKALDLDPGDIESRRRLAGLYRTLGQSEAAKEVLAPTNTASLSKA